MAEAVTWIYGIYHSVYLGCKFTGSGVHPDIHSAQLPADTSHVSIAASHAKVEVRSWAPYRLACLDLPGPSLAVCPPCPYPYPPDLRDAVNLQVMPLWEEQPRVMLLDSAGQALPAPASGTITADITDAALPDVGTVVLAVPAMCDVTVSSTSSGVVHLHDKLEAKRITVTSHGPIQAGKLRADAIHIASGHAGVRAAVLEGMQVHVSAAGDVAAGRVMAREFECTAGDSVQIEGLYVPAFLVTAGSNVRISACHGAEGSVHAGSADIAGLRGGLHVAAQTHATVQWEDASECGTLTVEAETADVKISQTALAGHGTSIATSLAAPAYSVPGTGCGFRIVEHAREPGTWQADLHALSAAGDAEAGTPGSHSAQSTGKISAAGQAMGNAWFAARQSLAAGSPAQPQLNIAAGKQASLSVSSWRDSVLAKFAQSKARK